MRKFSLVWLLAGLFCLAPVRGQATIINTLRGFSDTEAGWSGGMAASYGASGGNTEETHLRASAQLQYRSGDEIFRLLGSGKRSSSAGQETARAVMGHLRHNHRLSDRWSSLSFLQVQENPFQQLKSRTLLGLGGRWDVTAGPQRELALGAAFMWERERLEGQEGHTSARRLSLFLSYIRQLRPGVDLDALLFYQPSTEDFADYRLFGTLQIDVELAGNLSLVTGLQVGHDSRPPAAVEQTDWETTTGLKASF